MHDIYPSNRSDGNWYVLAAGLPSPTKPLVLAPGLSVRPLSSELTVFDLAAAGGVGFREWATLEPLVTECTCEIESAKDSDTSPGYDTLNRAFTTTLHAAGGSPWLIILVWPQPYWFFSPCGFSQHVCLACSSYSWSTIAGHQARTSDVFPQQLIREGVEAAVYRSERHLPPFHGNLLDYHLQTLAVGGSRQDPVNEADAEWCQTHFATFNTLAAESDRFRFALEGAMDWRYAIDLRSAIARIWSAIEALFGLNTELVYRMSLLAASLLEPRGEARKTRFASVRSLYGVRSKAVHGEHILEDNLKRATRESFSLLQELILLTIEKGHVLGSDDFDAAVFC